MRIAAHKMGSRKINATLDNALEHLDRMAELLKRGCER